MTALDPDLRSHPGRRDLDAETLAALTRAVAAAAACDGLDAALRVVAETARVAARADVAIVRVLDAASGRLAALAVAAPAPLAAELEGGWVQAADLPDRTVDALAAAPAAVRRAADRAGASALLLVPVRLDGLAASLELLRSGRPFSRERTLAAELWAAQLGLVLRAFAAVELPAGSLARPVLELAGEALEAALDEAHPAEEIVRVAAGVVDASAALLWERGDDGRLALAAAHGLAPRERTDAARVLAERTLAEPGPVRALPLPDGRGVSTALALGRPPSGVLQLLQPEGAEVGPEQLERLATFGVRAAHALRAGAGGGRLAPQTKKTRALLTVVGRASEELSLAHTLQAVVDGVADLLAVDGVAVYLRGADGRLEPAAGRGVAGPHTRVAERLLDLALARPRGGAVVGLDDASHGPPGALAAPLAVGDEVIGLLAVYTDPRRVGEQEANLLAAVAGQLAVAVQHAQLHERATRLVAEREQALRAERRAAQRLRALYEVSRSFAQTLSLEGTLAALARTVAEALDVDAAVIRMPDERRELLVPHAIHVRDAQSRAAIATLLDRPAPFGSRAAQRLWRTGRPARLDARAAARETGLLRFLASFFERGWSAALVPIGAAGEVTASLTLLSFRPDAPVSAATVEDALALVGQASLAVDNARLTEQQTLFAETMRRSLLPRARPDVPGLELGEVYESSTRVGVGGDVYDFLALGDGRLAVVLGDVMGRGVEATADMAMAKFVFRSLVREHPEPEDFLSSANDVICDELAPGKFVTLTYLAVDAARREVACASAGHPPPRLVSPGGEVGPLGVPGLVLGIDRGRRYAETRAGFPPGAALVLYTDGVVEARRDGELYGDERLDALLAGRRDLAADALARAVADDARAFARGALADDLAVVVIRGTS